MRIAVLSTPNAWHFNDLKRAAGVDCEVFNFPFEQLSAEIERDGSPMFNLEADCVIVRTMPPGSLQQIVFRMDLLARLQQSGVKVFNSPKSIEAAVDKYLSLSLLSAAGVPVPETKVAQTVDEAMQHFSQFRNDTVVKPIFGSMGNGISRIQDAEQAHECFSAAIEAGDVIYQQEFVDHPGFDLRLLVLGEKVLGMKRVNAGHWITNISRGGVGEPYVPTDFEIELALKSARAVGAHFAGVDVVTDVATQRQLVVEVNAVPGWRETSKVLNQDVAALLLDEIANQFRN